MNYSSVVTMGLVFALSSAFSLSPSSKTAGRRVGRTPTPSVRFYTVPRTWAETSSITVPISVSLAEAFSQMERELPREISRWDAWEFHGDWATEYHFRRDPLSLTLEGDKIKVRMKGYYRIRVGRKVFRSVVGVASCGDGEPEREVVLKAATTVRITPQWQVETKSDLQSLDYPNRCNATILDLDATGYINSVLEPIVKDALAKFDARTRGLDLRRKIEDIWQQAQGPIEAGDNTWLLISPETVLASPIIANNDDKSLNISVGITAHPKMLVGSKPQAATRPLPDLQAGTPVEGFYIDLEGNISYAAATDLLRKSLIGKQFEYGTDSVTISDAQVSGAAEQAVLRLGLEGSINGQISLTGKPRLDLTRNLLYVEDLDYTLETRNPLMQLIDLLRHTQFRQRISEAAHFPLSEEVARAQERLTQSLNRQVTPEIRLQGRVISLKPQDVSVGQDGFIVRVEANGEVKVQGVLSLH